jgi:hypothetical protein
VKAKASGVRKARHVRKAAVHRPARKAAPPVRQAAAPTPMPVAAAELATPRAYALIATTVCETGPRALGATDAAVPVLDIVPGGGFLSGTDSETFLPPVLGPGFPDIGHPVGGGPGLYPPPPILEPPVIPVPEPTTWALLILGFGFVGARLRAISSAGSGSPGRVRPRG